MEDYIDAGQATIITDRCKPPKNQTAAPSTVKSVLWCLRGLGAPGMTLSIPRGVIEDRTCLGETAVKKAQRVLLDHEILIQVGKPAPGRSAQFRLDYRKLAEWLDPSDRQIIRLDNIKPNAGATRPRSQARSAPEHRRDAPASDSTPAQSAPVEINAGATRPRSQARSAPGIKVEPALRPAKRNTPAAAAARAETAKDRTPPDADLQLANAAAAAAGVMDLEAWTRIGRRAGLEIDLAGQCAHTLIELGVEDAEVGMRALERLSERLSRIDHPPAFVRKLVAQDGGPEASKAAIRRERGAAQRRDRLLDAMSTWPRESHEVVRRKLRAHLEHELGEDVARQLMPCEQYARPLSSWTAMLDYIAVHWDAIKATPLPEAVAA